MIRRKTKGKEIYGKITDRKMRQYLHVYIHLKHDLFGCQSRVFPVYEIEIKANMHGYKIYRTKPISLQHMKIELLYRFDWIYVGTPTI